MIPIHSSPLSLIPPAERLSLEESNALSTSLSAALSSVSESTQLVSAPSGNMSLASAIFSVSSQLKNHAFARTLEVPYGIPLEDVALRWHGWSDNFAGSDAAPKGGFEALVSLVLADAQSRSAKVSLNSLVTSVAQTEGGVSVRTADGKEFKAKTVISTIPLGVLKRTASGLFKPLLPPRRLATIERTRVGILEKLALVYPNAWWPEANTTGSYTFLPTSSSTANLTGSAEEQAKRALDAHTISVASFAAPTLPNPHPTLLFYLSPGPALALADFSAEDAARGAHAFLVARFGLPATEVPQPIASTRSEWHKDPFAYGATSSPVAVGSDTSPLDFVELGKPLWNGMLGFAGEHTDADHRGSIAGAIKSGQREAERVELFLQRE